MAFRIGGLASGMDTDTIVSKLMKAERIPLDKLVQKRQTTIWQRESYLELNSKMYDYRNNKLFEFKKESTLSAKKVDLSGETDAVSARATGTATTGTLNVKVNVVAESAMKWSESDFRLDNTFSSSATLESQESKLNLSGGTFSQNEYTFKINNKSITVDVTKDSLDSVISKINGSDANVTAYYSGGKISLTSKTTGLINGDGFIKLEDDTSASFLTDALNLNLIGNTTGPGGDASRGVNADIVVNGLQTVSETNTITVNGVELTVKKQSATSTTVNVSTDTDKIIESIKGFVSNYNDILKTLQDKVAESRYRDFQPLTDEQKEDMKEDDIDRWEEKAKSGLLRNDSIISQAINEMRSAISARVDTGNSKYTSLSSIGIETGLYVEKGKLYLKDESKLRAALEDDPEAVMALFTANGESGSNGGDVGIAERIYNTFDKALKGIKDKAGVSSILSDSSLLGKQMGQLGEQIDAFNDRLTGIEDRYYRQFAAMEHAINNLNSQSASFLQSLAPK